MAVLCLLAGVPALPAASPPARAQPADAPLVRALAPEIRAQVTPRRSTVIAAEIAGKIAELPLRDGDRFAEGDRLVGFDCAVNRNRLARAKAAHEKLQRIHETKSRLNEMRSVGLLEVDVAAAELAEAEAEMGLMRIMVERCTITAPFPGRVSAVHAKRFQFVGEGEPLLEILDDSTLEVEIIVPSPWLAFIAPGFGFQILLDETGRSYPAKVTRLSGRVDPVSQSIRVYGEITGSHAELMAGMSGRALISPPADAVGR